MKRKFFTKVIALILCIANMFTILPSGVFADTNDGVVTLDFSEFRNTGRVRYGEAQLGDFFVTGITDAKEQNTTRRAFCATNLKVTPTNRSQFGLLTSSNDERLARVLYYGYVNPSSEVYGTTNPSDNLKIIVTSTAFSQIYSGASYANSGDALTMKKALINIAENTNYTVPNNKISVTKSNLAVSVSGNKQVSESTTFNGYQGNTININVPQGITLVNESKAGQKTTNATATITAGETFHFEADLSFAGEINTGNISGSMKDFKAFIAKGSNGLQDIATYGYVENSVPVQIKATFTPQLGNLEIIKDSDQHEITDLNDLYNLNRAEFKITNLETGKTYTQKVTIRVQDGSDTVKYKTVFRDIPAGTYKVEEITASIIGYRINKQSQNVEVVANESKSVTIKNVPITQAVTLIVQKNDEKNKPLEGAEFTLKFYKGEYTKEQIQLGQAGNADRTWVIRSDRDGKANLDQDHLVPGSDNFYYSSNNSICLPYGTLTIEETKAPAGYKDNNELYVYTIKGDNGVAYTSKFTPLTITNEPKMGTAEIIKTSTDGEVEGIEFEVTDSNNVTTSYFTDRNGKITQNLKVGHYVVKEIVPEGYICTVQNPQALDIVEGQTASVSFNNTPDVGSIAIRKVAVDAQGNRIEGDLSGFRFKVYKYDNVNKEIGEQIGNDDGYTTDSQGKISVPDDIEPGYYLVHEVLSANSEYAQPADQVKEVKANTTTTFNFLNAAQTFKFKLRKVLNTSSIPRNYRPTFKFEIESEDGLYKATEEILANSETTIDIEVPKPGTYKITEVLTEDQQKYWKNPEEGTKTVVVVETNTPDENVPTVTFTNEVKKGKILIKKTSDDGFVDEVEFSVVGRAYVGNVINTVVPTHQVDGENYGAYLADIPLGEYRIVERSSRSPYYFEASEGVDVIVDQEGETYPADFTNTYDRTIRIIKNSATGNREGFTFRITSDVLQSPIEVTTGKDGVVDIDNLKAGTYTIEEINLPEEWKQPDPQTVTINYIERAGKSDAQIAEELKPIEVTFENEYKPARVDIKKVSSENGNRGGWKFTIVGTDYKGNEVNRTVTTGNDGNIIAEDIDKLTLEAGSYTITEIDIPDGMVVPEPIQVTLEPGQTKTFEFENKFKKGNGRVIKLSEDEIYAGFTFRLYGTSDNGIAVDETVTTEESALDWDGPKIRYGYALFENIPVGTYTIEEINVPERYKINGSQEIKITENDTTVVEFENILDEVDYTIIKTSAYNGPVDGFKFMILPLDVPGLDINNFVTEYTTQDGGKINVRLKPGKYEITEIAYPGEDGIPAYAEAPEAQTVIVQPKGESAESQSITFTNRLKQGDLGTTAVDGKTNKNSAYVSEETTIIDTVAYEDFIPNQRYKMVGKIMDKATGEALKINNEEVVVEKAFTASETGNGSENLEFTFNSMDLKGKQIVVFEKSYILNDGDATGVEVAKHEDINDENQTITFVDPEISTQAKDTLTELNSSYVQTNSTIVDTVNCKGIIPNVGGYTLKCDLIDKDTGEVIVINDKPVSATKEFTANSEEVNVNVYLYVDTTSLIGKNVVCYETLYYGNEVIAEHKDINDDGQTIEYKNPEIKTTIKDKDTKTQDAYTKKKTTLIDTVSYTGLIPGKTYTVSGILMNKETNEPLLIDGKEVIATKEFVAKEADGTVDIEFKFNSTGLKDKEIVAFEYLDYEDVEIAVHADINDKAQTIKFIEGDIPKTGGKISTEFVLVIMSAVIVTAAVLFRKKYKKARNN